MAGQEIIFDSIAVGTPPTAEPESTGTPTDGTLSVVFPPAGFDVTSYGHWGFGLTVSYDWDSGLRAAPKAAPARTRLAFWRAHSEVTYKVVTCASARLLLNPVMPHIDTGDPNDVLLRREISAPSRQEMPDGSEMIVVVQRLVYAMQMAQAVGQPILIPNNILNVGAQLQLYPDSFLKILHGGANPPADAGDVAAITY